jgi:hypothetical protein
MVSVGILYPAGQWGERREQGRVGDPRVAIIPDYGRTLEEATKNADIAMYCSNELGRTAIPYRSRNHGEGQGALEVGQEMSAPCVPGACHGLPVIVAPTAASGGWRLCSAGQGFRRKRASRGLHPMRSRRP